MNRWPLIIGAGCILLGGCTSPSVSKPPPGIIAQQEAAPAALVAGGYTGNWANSDGNSGTLEVTLAKPENSPWQASVSFNYQGIDAVGTVESVLVNGNQIKLTYDYNIQDHEGTVVMTGKQAGNKLQGSFEITKGDASPGTWEATRVR